MDDIKAGAEGDIRITACPVLSEAVSGADVVATVTMTSEPVLHGEWLKPGALVCCKHLPFEITRVVIFVYMCICQYFPLPKPCAIS